MSANLRHINHVFNAAPGGRLRSPPPVRVPVSAEDPKQEFAIKAGKAERPHVVLPCSNTFNDGSVNIRCSVCSGRVLLRGGRRGPASLREETEASCKQRRIQRILGNPAPQDAREGRAFRLNIYFHSLALTSGLQPPRRAPHTTPTPQGVNDAEEERWRRRTRTTCIRSALARGSLHPPPGCCTTR